MNPLLQSALLSILRTGLQWLASYLVAAGIWKGGDAELYVTGASIGILSLAWTIWDKSKARRVLLTALNIAETSENDVKSVIKSGAVTPVLSTPPNTVPGIPDTSTGK